MRKLILHTLLLCLVAGCAEHVKAADSYSHKAKKGHAMNQSERQWSVYIKTRGGVVSELQGLTEKEAERTALTFVPEMFKHAVTVNRGQRGAGGGGAYPVNESDSAEIEIRGPNNYRHTVLIAPMDGHGGVLSLPEVTP